MEDQPIALRVLRAVVALQAEIKPWSKVDPDLAKEAGMDGNLARLLQAARDIDLDAHGIHLEESEPCPDHGSDCPGLGLCDWQNGAGVYAKSPEVPEEPKVLRNCWSCAHARKETRSCVKTDLAVGKWIVKTHPETKVEDSACPPLADGCPGWAQFRRRDRQPAYVVQTSTGLVVGQHGNWDIAHRAVYRVHAVRHLGPFEIRMGKAPADAKWA